MLCAMSYSISLRGGWVTSLPTIRCLLAIATLWSSVATLRIAALSTVNLISTDPTNQARRRATTVIIARRILIIVSRRGRQKRIFDFPNSSLGSDRELEVFALDTAGQ